MNLEEMASRVQDAVSVRRVFGEPYTHDGVMVIPVASVGAGAGGGSGRDGEHDSHGEGGGFGGGGRPIGAYVVRDGEVTWRPAVDINRVIGWAGAVLVGLFWSVAQVQRTRAKTRRKVAKARRRGKG